MEEHAVGEGYWGRGVLKTEAVIKVVDRVRFTICDSAFQLGKCSAMEAKIKCCELLLRTLNEILNDGRLLDDNVEKAVKEMGNSGVVQRLWHLTSFFDCVL